MKRKKRIESILSKNFPHWKAEVNDTSILHKGHNNFDGNNETHILVHLKKNSKLELNRLEVHRKINSLLIKEFDSGLHSLEIKII